LTLYRIKTLGFPRVFIRYNVDYHEKDKLSSHWKALRLGLITLNHVRDYNKLAFYRITRFEMNTLFIGYLSINRQWIEKT